MSIFGSLVECKFARNSLTNWKTKIFQTNIVKNIVLHLFAGESHQVVKFTVIYYLFPNTLEKLLKQKFFMFTKFRSKHVVLLARGISFKAF